MAKSPASNDTLELPDAVYEELQRLRDLIRSDTVKREIPNRHAASPRRFTTHAIASPVKRHRALRLKAVAR